MKAIAKYLLVEGEIREGELYFNEHNHLTVYAGISKPDDKCKKVKLFAVTQDIKKGDEFYYEREGKKLEGLVCKDEMPSTNRTEATNGTNYNELNCFKVLGELSPNATWVKEGDEIEFELHSEGLVVKEFKEVVNMEGAINHGKIGDWVHIDLEDSTSESYFLHDCIIPIDHIGEIKTVSRVKCPTCNTYH